MSAATAFISDKSSFFSSNEAIFSTIDAKAAKKTQAYLLQNLTVLQQEFSTLFRSLQQQPKDKEKFWLYAYYCARQLERYYRNYDQALQANALQAHAENIQKIIEARTAKPPQPHKAPKESPFYLDNLYHSIMKAFSDVIATVSRASVARDKAGYVNMLRLLYMVARLTLLNLAVVANDMGLLRQFNILFKQDINLALLQQRLGTLQGLSNVLSVALFAMRALINTAMIIKHTAFPSEAERQAGWMERLTFELSKRHGMLLNDVVWSLVNLFTNYPQILGLGLPAIIGTTVVFQLFDFALLLWLWEAEGQKYKVKHDEFSAQIDALMEKGILDANDTSVLQLLLQQQRFLDCDHNASHAFFQINCAAALLLMSGFGMGFLLATPLASAGAFMVCAVAVSMYWSASNYKDMVYKGERLALIKKNGGNLEAALEDYQTSQITFASNLAKYAIMPTLIMGTMVLFWQAALALILVYGAYECWQSNDATKPSMTEAEMLSPAV